MPPKHGPPPPSGDKDDECVSSKELHAMIKSMTELFTKNQQSTETSLEQVERSIAGVLDRFDILETRLPPVDQAKHAKESHEEDYDNEEEGRFNPPRRPPRQQYDDEQEAQQEIPCPPRRPNWHSMGGHPYHGPNQRHAHSNDDPFAKVKFTIPPFYDLYGDKTYLNWEMTVDQKFSSHLVLNNIVLNRPLVSLRILLLSNGMNCLAFVYNRIHVIF
jgi:hypothetical protein